MSAVAIPEKQAASFWGTETTYGTTPSMTRCFPTSIKLKPKQTNLKVEEERNRGRKHIIPVQGLKSCEGEIGWLLKPDGSQLTAAASAATPWGMMPFKTLWGGEAAAAGSTVQSSSTTTSVIVGTGHGSRFAVGTVIAVEVSGSLEVTEVISVSTDTLTVWPQLSATPTTSGVVVNSYTYYPVDAYAAHNASTSMAIQHALAATNVTGYADFQWTVNAATGLIEISIERDKLISAVWKLAAAKWTGPSDQSITVSAASDAMATAMPVRTGRTLIQALSSTTRTHVPIKSIGLKFPEENKLIEELDGTLEGTSGVQKITARPGLEVTIKQLADTSVFSSHYTSQTKLAIWHWTQFGSGTTARFVGVVIPTAVVGVLPVYDEEGGLKTVEYTLEAMEDEKTSGATTDLALAAYRVFML